MARAIAPANELAGNWCPVTSLVIPPRDICNSNSARVLVVDLPPVLSGISLACLARPVAMSQTHLTGLPSRAVERNGDVADLFTSFMFVEGAHCRAAISLGMNLSSFFCFHLLR